MLKRLFAAFLLLAVLGYLAASAYLYFNQRSFLYSPPSVPSRPVSESIAFTTSGETLRIWTRSGSGSDAVIYFGGKGEDVSAVLPDISAALPDQSVYLPSYRGYGGSTGSPSEEALFADALAVYDLVSQTHPHVAVVGRSLGTGVAVYVASKRPVQRLTLVTPYDSIENIAKSRFPIFPISLLLKDKFDSASRVREIKAKTLVLLAENDGSIPRSNSDALIAQFPSEQVTVSVLQGTDHNTIASSPLYFEQMHRFLISE